MKKDVSKVLEAFKALEIDFEDGYFESIQGRKNEAEIIANENGILALAYLLIDYVNDKPLESEISKKTLSKFIIDVILVG